MKKMKKLYSIISGLLCTMICFSACDKKEVDLTDVRPDIPEQVVPGEKPIDKEAEILAKRYQHKAAIVMMQLQRGYDFAKTNGVEKLVDVLKNQKDPRRKLFVAGDYYIWIIKTDFRTNAIVVAHPINRAIENRDYFDIKDADGKLFIKDILRLTSHKEKGWCLTNGHIRQRRLLWIN